MTTEKDPLVFFTFLGVIGITALIWYLSIKIGADFGTTLKAVTLSLVALGISGTIYYITRIISWAHFTGTLALLWPCWWAVIDSVANNGMAPDKIPFRFPNEIWWNTEMFFYGTEGALVVITIFLVYLNRREGYAY